MYHYTFVFIPDSICSPFYQLVTTASEIFLQVHPSRSFLLPPLCHSRSSKNIFLHLLQIQKTLKHAILPASHLTLFSHAKMHQLQAISHCLPKWTNSSPTLHPRQNTAMEVCFQRTLSVWQWLIQQSNHTTSILIRPTWKISLRLILAWKLEQAQCKATYGLSQLCCLSTNSSCEMVGHLLYLLLQQRTMMMWKK